MATKNPKVVTLRPNKLLSYINDKENWKADPVLKLALANVVIFAVIMFYVSN